MRRTLILLTALVGLSLLLRAPGEDGELAPLQAQPGADGLQRLAHSLECTLELTVLSRTINVIQHGEEISKNPSDRHIAGGLAVAIHALAIVRILGVHPAQVICEFNDLGIHRGEICLKNGLAVRHRRIGNPGGRGSR